MWLHCRYEIDSKSVLVIKPAHIGLNVIDEVGSILYVTVSIKSHMVLDLKQLIAAVYTSQHTQVIVLSCLCLKISINWLA